jgi:hypothetical protein
LPETRNETEEFRTEKWIYDMVAKKSLSDLLKRHQGLRDKYYYTMVVSARLAAAVERRGVTSPKRFRQRAREMCDAWVIAERDAAETLEAINDCGGDRLMEEEVLRAMRLKHGTGGHSFRGMSVNERVRIHRRGRREALLKIGRREPPVFVFESLVEALMIIRDWESHCRDQIILIADEMAIENDIERRRKLRKERKSYEGDLKELMLPRT